MKLSVDCSLRENGFDDAGWPWFDVDGVVGEIDGLAVHCVGRAQLRGEHFYCQALIDGVAREVELTITIEPHGCGRDDCGRRRDPDRGGTLYYARLVCGHGDWPCAQGCRRPVHPVERCPGPARVEVAR